MRSLARHRESLEDEHLRARGAPLALVCTLGAAVLLVAGTPSRSLAASGGSEGAPIARASDGEESAHEHDGAGHEHGADEHPEHPDSDDNDHEHDAGEPAAKPARRHRHVHQHLTEEERRALGETLYRHVDPQLEAPTGVVLVFVTGTGIDAAEAKELEEALIAGAGEIPAVTLLAGTAIKESTAGLSSRCREVGSCMASLARELAVPYVLTCEVQGESHELRLTDLERAEDIGGASVTPVGADRGVVLGAAVREVFVRATPEPLARDRHPGLGVETPDHEGGPGWRFLPGPAPFIGVAAVTGLTFLIALGVSLDYQARMGEYELLATQPEPVDGSRLRGLEGSARSLAVQANVLWSITAGLTVVTGLAGIFTDWSGGAAGPSVAVTAGPGGAGAALRVRY